MVVTPDVHPLKTTGSFSPLLLASTGSSQHPPRRSSTGSFSQLSDFRLDNDSQESEHEPGHGVADLRHVDLSIDASEWRKPVFKEKIHAVLRKLRVPSWASPQLTPSSIHLQKITGATTNAVFFVTFNPHPNPTSPTMSPLLTPTIPPSDPSHPPTIKTYPPTLLLRVYGPNSDALISRTEELGILHVLSSRYGLGPKVFGTFGNGRVEQFFPSRALTPTELRDVTVSRGIAKRMRELHSVDLGLLGYSSQVDKEPKVWRCLREWSALANEILASLGSAGSEWKQWVDRFALDQLRQEMETYRTWVDEQETGPVVFAHNDTQYGNLLKLDTPLPHRAPDHHRYIVIDFEYAAPNPRGYDIGNHFHEWRADYHHPELSHSMQHYPYPTPQQRQEFYRAYLASDSSKSKVDRLEQEVRLWSPASSAFWALWGVVQGVEQVQSILDGRGMGSAADFCYLTYAMERVTMFRQEASDLGFPLPK